MKKLIIILGSIGCWVCIIWAAVTYGLRAGAAVALAVLLEAIIAAAMMAEYIEEVQVEVQAQMRAWRDSVLGVMSNMEDDGK